LNPGGGVGGRRGAACSAGWPSARGPGCCCRACAAPCGAAASRQSARRDLCCAQAPCGAGCAAGAGGPGRPASRGACAAGARLRGGEAGCRTRCVASLTASPAACAAPVARVLTQRGRVRGAPPAERAMADKLLSRSGYQGIMFMA